MFTIGGGTDQPVTCERLKARPTLSNNNNNDNDNNNKDDDDDDDDDSSHRNSGNG